MLNCSSQRMKKNELQNNEKTKQRNFGQIEKDPQNLNSVYPTAGKNKTKQKK